MTAKVLLVVAMLVLLQGVATTAQYYGGRFRGGFVARRGYGFAAVGVRGYPGYGGFRYRYGGRRYYG